MKKVLTNIFVVTALITLVGCSRSNETPTPSSSVIPSESSEPSIESSSFVESSAISSKDATSVSSASKTSAAPSSSSIQNTSKSSSANPGYKENELSTASGLVVKFKATGASIDTIKWDNTQIAKDGFVVGRCANRIANGKFSIDGTQYSVSINSNPHSLHGGAGSGNNSWRGPFATKDWTKVEQTSSTITYAISSADGENGYPGKMDMTVKYTLSQEGELSIEYTATTTKDTLCNPTNHLYMNLNGSNARNYNNVSLQINADNYTPLNNQIPTGAISPVAGTKFDYRNESAFKGSEDYDDNYVLNGTGYRKVASMTGGATKIKVDVFTDRPGLQLYKAGNGDICLESQMFPDMINHPEFAEYGTTILRANETFTSKTAYVFSKLS